MTRPRDHGPFDVPLAPLAGTATSGARARLAAVLALGAIGGAIGLAVVSGSIGPQRDPGPRDGDVALVAPSWTPYAALPLDPPPEPSIGRVEGLLDVDDVALAGAPVVDIVLRSGSDLRLERWSPGAGRSELLTVRGALANWAGSPVLPIVSPDDQRVLVLRFAGASGDRGEARLVNADGTLAWSSDDVEAISGGIWSDDGRTLVVAARSHGWHILTIGPDGAATDRLVSLVLERFVPSPPPIGSLSPPPIEPRAMPLGFSADGRWIYGGFVSPDLGTFSGTFRVARDGPRIEWSTTFRVGRRDGLVPVQDYVSQRLVDPTTGRIANWRINSNISGGPPTIEVRRPDNAFQFLVEAETPIGSAWGQAGDLFVLSADSLLFPTRSVIVRYGVDGAESDPLVEIGPVSGTGLLGYRDGFLGLGISVTRPDAASQIVLIDVADSTRRTALVLPTSVTKLLVATRMRSGPAFTPATP